MRRRNPQKLPEVVVTAQEMLNLLELAAAQNPDAHNDHEFRAVIYRAKSIKALGHVWLTVDWQDVGGEGD